MSLELQKCSITFVYLGITMPNLHEMGDKNAPLIMAQLKDVTAYTTTVSS